MKIRFNDLKRLNAPYRNKFLALSEEFYDGGYYLGVNHPAVRGFEDNFAKYCGTDFCVGTSNGLDAIILALRALNIGAGDEVIVPAQTFIATWLAVSYVGATPVPVDVEPRSANIDASKIEAAITGRTKAIVAVHLHGYMSDMVAIKAIADRHGLKVIEDAAQAHGHVRGNKHIGELGDVATFSFYPAKNLGALGDAGAIVTNDGALADRIRTMANYGSKEKYVHELAGANNRLDPLQAIFLDLKLTELDNIIARRREIAASYSAPLETLSLDGGDRIQRLLGPVQDIPVWHNFVVEVHAREEFMRFMAEREIETLIHYPIIPSEQECYASLGVEPEAFPAAFANSQHSVSLPIGEYLSDEEVKAVCSALTDWVSA